MSDERFYQLRFIRVGNTILNPAHIVQVDLKWDTEKNIVRVYQVYQGDDSASDIDFKGEEADALRHYFGDNSRDLVAEMQADELASTRVLSNAMGTLDTELPY